jgi:hypothetical protein
MSQDNNQPLLAPGGYNFSNIWPFLAKTEERWLSERSTSKNT